jgi:2-polyprenyl-3-methyl-5-hydroxy-6-metoxy-1,4-benzoquinol methylase
MARARGLTAFTSDDFKNSEYAVPESFDSILVAHVLEHMTHEFGVSLLREYLPYLRPGGTVCLITPQERGFKTDATHVNFVDFAKLAEVAREVGLTETRRYSFPFPRFAGTTFPYNEFILLATK